MAAYFSPLNFLHFKDHLEGLEEGKIAAPAHIRVKLTNHRNHHCVGHAKNLAYMII